MLKMAVQQGRSERGAEAYFFRYVEAPSDASTTLTDIFSIRLLEDVAPRRAQRKRGINQADVGIGLRKVAALLVRAGDEMLRQ